MATELPKVIKVTEGEQIKGLFERPSSVDITIESKKYGTMKFVIRPMNNDVYARMGESMKGEGINLDKLTSIDGLKVFSAMYYPAMKVIFPACCISPKIIDGVSSDKSVLCIQDMPMEVCMELFQQIMEASGLSEKEEISRKNL